MSNHAMHSMASHEIGFMPAGRSVGLKMDGRDSGPMARAGRMAADAWTNYRAWSELRRATRHLASLDDRVLRDIGVSRSEINRMVYGPMKAGHDRG
ncbi:MAG: DUF1127 domain-containing protein [Dongiaceae bacterium]